MRVMDLFDIEEYCLHHFSIICWNYFHIGYYHNHFRYNLVNDYYFSFVIVGPIRQTDRFGSWSQVLDERRRLQRKRNQSSQKSSIDTHPHFRFELTTSKKRLNRYQEELWSRQHLHTKSQYRNYTVSCHLGKNCSCQWKI